MTADTPAPLVVNGWAIFVHPLFVSHLESMLAGVGALERTDPAGYSQQIASKHLAAITKLALKVIAQDTARPEYRQGGALGDGRRHRFRAKFFQRYRVLFRYHASSRIIVHAWVNDDDTERAHENRDEACRVFRRVLESRRPSDDRQKLLAHASTTTEDDRSTKTL